MIDSVQFILFFVIVILAVLIIVLGIQVYFILRDFRQTIAKANKVLDDAGTITENVSAPISTLSSLSNNLKAGSFLTVIKLAKNFLAKDEEEDRKGR
jgi:hypothetical protein